MRGKGRGSELESRARELMEQWLQGNRKDVLRALTSMSSMRAAYTASMITVFLMDDATGHQGAQSFVRAMAERLK
jgi:hypothetical protein